ncbi:hypothetical protein QBC36DRAFT_342883 [Triangularia setosa]|uniref:Alcohol dehydrogenase-like C-terminal domain-containing protein n=1 Tax=Triangularia setosa TaxID=2587417 RepID=A0AAN6WEQ7_9PEZI|nr:hypothetical protein QBC36DRAFT_342883 [Podospora setosa]
MRDSQGFDFAGFNVAVKTPVLDLTWPGPNRPLYTGAHQPYILTQSDLIWMRPKVGLPIALLIAADAFVNILGFGFPSAGIEQLPSGKQCGGKAALIWGGASAVGWAAIQVAREIGVEFIFTMAPTKNHELLKDIRATHIKQTLQRLGVELAAVFDAVGAGLEEVEGAFESSTCYWGKQCLSHDTHNKQGDSRGALLCALTVPTESDPDWDFAIFSRQWGALEEEFPEWTWQTGQKNHATAWKSLPTRVVQAKEDAITTINSSTQGRISCEVVIRHPILF